MGVHGGQTGKALAPFPPMMTPNQWMEAVALGVRRGMRSQHIVTRSHYQRDARLSPGRWGLTAVDLPRGTDRRLVDLSLPEPQPVTVYLEMDQPSANMQGVAFDLAWNVGGAEQTQRVPVRAVGSVVHVCAQSLRVKGVHLASSPDPTQTLRAQAALGSPVQVDQTEHFPAVGSAPAAVTVPIPRFAYSFSVESPDAVDFAASVIDQLTRTGPRTFVVNTWPTARFATHVPIDAGATQLRITGPPGPATLEGATVCWRILS